MSKKIIFFLALFSTFCHSQDIHLSQFYASDYLLNPAKIGDHEGDFRFSANYRNQWRQIGKQPISTFIAGFDHMFYLKNYEFDAGIMLASDRFSGSEYNTISNSNIEYVVNTSKVMLSLGCGKQVGNQFFRAGIQTGVLSSATDPENQSFPSQWEFNLGDFNTKKPSLESNLKSSKKVLDISIGGQWSTKIDQLQPKLGFSLSHINRPLITFFDAKGERLKVKKILYSECDFPLNELVTIQPKLFFMWTNKSNDFLMGSHIRKRMDNNKIASVNAGLFYRHGIARNLDAIIPSIGIHWKRWDFGLSYDVTLSSMSSGVGVKTKGSLEFSAIYTSDSTIPKNAYVQCDRY